MLKIILILVTLSALPLHACTIFVLTDGERTLFCNNEDWSNPKTRIWFLPGDDEFYGCVYVGFDNGWGQGGMNTKGLAYDWVAGYREQWEPGSELKVPRGNSAERMLESCATVQEAITFFKEYKEPSFSYARILVGDASGTSAMIGAKDGRLDIKILDESRGFGFGRRQLRKLLPKHGKPTEANGIQLLRACKQPGRTSTKYANLFDLRTGDITLLPRPDLKQTVRLNLKQELAQGPHYYDLPEIEQQLGQAPLPLLNSMKRYVFDLYEPIPDLEPEIAQRIQRLMKEARNGRISSADYTDELWQQLKGIQAEIQADLEKVGKVVKVTLVEHQKNDRRYIVDFARARILLHVVIDAQNRVAVLNTEANERKE